MATANKASRISSTSGRARTATARQVRGEIRASGENQVRPPCAARACSPTKIKKRRMRSGKKIKPKDIAIFTRQLATMMKAGVPLLQAFDIVGRGNTNPSVTKLLNDIRTDVETGTSLSAAFRKYPLYFDNLYCNLVEAGEAAGILEAAAGPPGGLHGKDRGDQVQDQVGADVPHFGGHRGLRRRAVIMIFVIPAFKEVFTSFGADLPAPTLFRDAESASFREVVVADLWRAGRWLLLSSCRPGSATKKCRCSWTDLLLRIPIFGDLINKSAVARWTRTLSTMFAAGVPLVEALDSVGGAAGNSVYAMATDKIQQEVSTGTSLTAAMTNANVFPSMVLQMCAIGEESGSIDHMLGKAADFYEAEVDEMVAGLSSLMEPIIIVFLGTLIGGIVVSMYLPIFKLGQVV
jgi:type IV pilus assembly protein PilC